MQSWLTHDRAAADLLWPDVKANSPQVHSLDDVQPGDEPEQTCRDGGSQLEHFIWNILKQNLGIIIYNMFSQFSFRLIVMILAGVPNGRHVLFPFLWS